MPTPPVQSFQALAHGWHLTARHYATAAMPFHTPAERHSFDAAAVECWRARRRYECAVSRMLGQRWTVGGAS